MAEAGEQAGGERVHEVYWRYSQGGKTQLVMLWAPRSRGSPVNHKLDEAGTARSP
jgi:hypothetical protein